MNRLLGVHVTSLVDGLSEALERWKPPVVVTPIADAAWSRLKKASPGTLVIFDAHEGQNGLTDRTCRSFVEGLEQSLGAAVGIYTSRSKASQIKLGAWAAKHPLWVADWSGRDEPLIPGPWEEAGRTYAYWQFKVAPAWPGFPGAVDLDRRVRR